MKMGASYRRRIVGQEHEPTVEPSEWKVDRQWRSRLSRDISQAIEEVVEHPENAVVTLRVLNSRLRPLGIRLELINPRDASVLSDPPD